MLEIDDETVKSFQQQVCPCTLLVLACKLKAFHSIRHLRQLGIAMIGNKLQEVRRGINVLRDDKGVMQCVEGNYLTRPCFGFIVIFLIVCFPKSVAVKPWGTRQGFSHGYIFFETGDNCVI